MTLSPDTQERITREKEAYDHGDVHAESGKLQRRFYQVFECPNTMRAERYLDQKVEEYARGKDILDFGCYDGWMIPRFAAMQPASITGVDISQAGIDIAIQKYGNLAKFYCGDAHATPFADNSFDLVVGRSILHHLNFELGLKEVARITRPGGHIVFTEPLYDNPAAKIMRALTPKARTEDEKPLSAEQIHFADNFFGGKSEHFFINLISTPLAMVTSLLPTRPDNLLLRAADAADTLIAKTPMKYWMRQAVLIWQKAPAS
jgi:SAM-dependent methyltransferase